MKHSPFLLDPEVVFLNHGSFGSCPVPVFEVYQKWQRELESQPVEFLARRAEGLLAVARQRLAQAYGTQRDNLGFVVNATTAVNTVARSLPLGPGHEVLSTDHEYGAIDMTWRFLAERQGFEFVRTPLPLPLREPKDYVETVWAAVTRKTRLLCLSHISSATGLVFPVEEVVLRAREAGIWTLIDGAHVPGQWPLDLDALGADFYAANLHKWLCAPKGSAFLYARPEVQQLIRPLVLSWGWDNPNPTINTRYVDYVQCQGTRDISAFLSVPAALDFSTEHHTDEVRERCRKLAAEAREELIKIAGRPALAESHWLAQMAAVELPPSVQVHHLKEWLYEKHRIEVPVWSWNGRPLLRLSIQSYNRTADVNQLLRALRSYLEL